MWCCLLQLLWNYKLNLTTDPKFESVATEVCKSTIAEVGLQFSCKQNKQMSSNTPSVCAQTLLQIKECNEEERGRGYLVSCLVDHRGNISEYQCNQYITKMTSIIFSDYRLICGFMDKCKEDVNNLHCGSINVGHKVGSGRVNFCPFSWEFMNKRCSQVRLGRYMKCFQY